MNLNRRENKNQGNVTVVRPHFSSLQGSMERTTVERVSWILNLFSGLQSWKQHVSYPKCPLLMVFPMKFSLAWGRRGRTEPWRGNPQWRSPVLSFLRWNQNAHLAGCHSKVTPLYDSMNWTMPVSVLHSKWYVNTKDVFVHGLGEGLCKFKVLCCLVWENSSRCRASCMWHSLASIC